MRIKKIEHSVAVWSEATNFVHHHSRREADHAPSGLRQEQKGSKKTNALQRCGAKRQILSTTIHAARPTTRRAARIRSRESLGSGETP